MKKLTSKLFRRRNSQGETTIARAEGRFSDLEMLEGRRMLSTYYAAPTGSDSAAGTLNAPFATLSKAVNAAKSGDTVILRGGTYAGNVTINKSNLLIEGMTGETAKIVSPTNSSGAAFGLDFDTEASHDTIKNLDISGGYYYAVKTETTRSYSDTTAAYHGASYLTFDSVKIHDSGTHVVKLSPDSDHLTFTNCEIYNSGVRDPNQGQGIDAVNVDDLVFKNNYIHDTTQNAIFVKGGSQRCLIENNLIRNSGYSGILLGQDTDAGAFDTTQNPQRYEAIDCSAIGNTVVNSKYSGIGTYSALNTTIQNNMILGAAGTGQAGIFFSINGAGKVGQNATVTGNTVQVVAGKPQVMILNGVFSGTPTFANNDYYNSNRFEDDRINFTGTLAQWQAKGYDQGSTYTAGIAPASNGDLNHDGLVNIDDFLILDTQVPLGKSGAWWIADANLDGTLNTDDYIVLDSAAAAPDTAPAAVQAQALPQDVTLATTTSAAVAAPVQADAAVSPVIAGAQQIGFGDTSHSDVTVAAL